LKQCYFCGSTKTQIKKGKYEQWYWHRVAEVDDDIVRACRGCHANLTYNRLTKEEWYKAHKNIPQWQPGSTNPNYRRYPGKQTREKMSEAHSGKNHWHWKGGITTNDAGYLMQKCEDHPRVGKNGYVRQHVLVMEKHLGRYLKDGEVVHHKNGVRTDNRIENLQLMTKQQHDRYHYYPQGI
jgi:hypothetical protein